MKLEEILSRILKAKDRTAKEKIMETKVNNR